MSASPCAWAACKPLELHSTRVSCAFRLHALSTQSAFNACIYLCTVSCLGCGSFLSFKTEEDAREVLEGSPTHVDKTFHGCPVTFRKGRCVLTGNVCITSCPFRMSGASFAWPKSLMCELQRQSAIFVSGLSVGTGNLHDRVVDCSLHSSSFLATLSLPNTCQPFPHPPVALRPLSPSHSPQPHHTPLSPSNGAGAYGL